MRMFKCISVLVFTLVLGACTSKSLYNVNNGVIPQNTSLEQSTAMIKAALRYKRWNIESIAPGKIMANIDVRKHSATISIDFDSNGFKIKHVKSTLLDHNPNHNTIHRNYNNWIKNLESEIKYFLANPDAANTSVH